MPTYEEIISNTYRRPRGYTYEGYPDTEAAQEYVPLINSTAAFRGISPRTLYNVAGQESDYDPNKTTPGPGGPAQGIMQLMPGTRRELEQRWGYPIDPYNPEQAVDAGARYLSEISQRPGFQGDMGLTASGYNAGPGYIQNALRQAQQINQQGDEVPPDTMGQFYGGGSPSSVRQRQSFWGIGGAPPPFAEETGMLADFRELPTQRDPGQFYPENIRSSLELGVSPQEMLDTPNWRGGPGGLDALTPWNRAAPTQNWMLPGQGGVPPSQGDDEFAPQGPFPGEQRSLDDLFRENFRLDEPTPNDGGPRRPPDRFGDIGGLDEFSGASRNYQERFGVPYDWSHDQPPADRDEAYGGTEQRTPFELRGGIGGLARDIFGTTDYLGALTRGGGDVGQGRQLFDTSAELAGGTMGSLADVMGGLPEGWMRSPGGADAAVPPDGTAQDNIARRFPGGFQNPDVWPQTPDVWPDMSAGEPDIGSTRIRPGDGFTRFLDEPADTPFRTSPVRLEPQLPQQNPDVWPDINQPQGNWMPNWRPSGNFPQQGLDPVPNAPTYDESHWMPDWRSGGNFPQRDVPTQIGQDTGPGGTLSGWRFNLPTSYDQGAQDEAFDTGPGGTLQAWRNIPTAQDTGPSGTLQGWRNLPTQYDQGAQDEAFDTGPSGQVFANQPGGFTNLSRYNLPGGGDLGGDRFSSVSRLSLPGGDDGFNYQPTGGGYNPAANWQGPGGSGTLYDRNVALAGGGTGTQSPTLTGYSRPNSSLYGPAAYDPNNETTALLAANDIAHNSLMGVLGQNWQNIQQNIETQRNVPVPGYVKTSTGNLISDHPTTYLPAVAPGGTNISFTPGAGATYSWA